MEVSSIISEQQDKVARGMFVCPNHTVSMEDRIFVNWKEL